MIYRQGKYLFPSFEKAKKMKDSLISTEEEPNNNIPFGLKQECIKKPVYENGEVIEDAEYSDSWQLDVAWIDLPNEGTEENPIYDHPYGWKKYSVDVKGQGNSVILGIEYNDVKF